MDPSLVHHLRAEKQSCASETQRSEKDRERKKQRPGESKNTARQEKTGELLQKIKLPLKEKKTQKVFFFTIQKQESEKGAPEGRT